MEKKLKPLLLTALILEIGLLFMLPLAFRSFAAVPSGGLTSPSSAAQTARNIPLPENLTMRGPEQEFKIGHEEMLRWRPRLDGAADGTGLTMMEKHMGEDLLSLEKALNRPTQDAVLVIANQRAVEFVPHRAGLVLDLAESRRRIRQALLAGSEEIGLAVVTSRPKTKLSALNQFGIQELLASGRSDFSGSSPSRIQNIRVGAAQYRGLIIPPGEEFSFNQNLGIVDAAHGYLPELVIKPEGTVPEFGGGLCQVSSTAFRAAFFAGLPITARRNHSYAVRYYDWISDDLPKAPGLDATIYPGYQDLKFINNTPGAILIWTALEGNRLFFDFYGTPDDREVVIDGPHPYDRRPSGAVKSSVTRTVIFNNGDREETVFQSNYVSPNLFPRVFEYPPPPPVNGGNAPENNPDGGQNI